MTPDVQAKSVAERLKEFDIKCVYISPFYRLVLTFTHSTGQISFLPIVGIILPAIFGKSTVPRYPCPVHAFPDHTL